MELTPMSTFTARGLEKSMKIQETSMNIHEKSMKHQWTSSRIIKNHLEINSNPIRTYVLVDLSCCSAKRQPRCPCPWAHWPPRWNPGHQLSPQTSELSSTFGISQLSMENNGNIYRKPMGFFTIHGPGSCKLSIIQGWESWSGWNEEILGIKAPHLGFCWEWAAPKPFVSTFPVENVIAWMILGSLL